MIPKFIFLAVIWTFIFYYITDIFIQGSSFSEDGETFVTTPGHILLQDSPTYLLIRDYFVTITSVFITIISTSHSNKLKALLILSIQLGLILFAFFLYSIFLNNNLTFSFDGVIMLCISLFISGVFFYITRNKTII